MIREAVQPVEAGRRQKVLHIGKFYTPHRGGIESYLDTICTQLGRLFDVSVIVANETRKTREDVINGVPVSRLGNLMTVASTSFCPAMISRIRASRADLIHIHLPNPTAVLAYLASGCTGRLVFSYHSDVVRQKVLDSIFRPIQRVALMRSSAIIVSSPHLLRSSVLSEFQERCHVIPYGLPIDQFARPDLRKVNDLRQRYGERIVLSVGRLVYYKGLEYAIRSMTQVDATLLIVGDGPLRAKLQKLAVDLGVSNRVVFLGEIPDDELRTCYHAADVFVLASIARSESFGIVQIEALAAAKPVINTNIDSGVPFVSLNGVSGITVPPADSVALAAAINRLLDDPELRAKFGRAGRLRAQSEFSVEAMSQRTVQLYESVMAQPPRTGFTPSESLGAKSRSESIPVTRDLMRLDARSSSFSATHVTWAAD
jgi:glycosyltransferase involved in cell wall biosynthesis